MLTAVSAVRAASNNRALMMETARTSETSVNIYLTTGQYIPEDCKLHTSRRENLKTHKIVHVNYTVLKPRANRWQV
jgi:hypothetical protein